MAAGTQNMQDLTTTSDDVSLLFRKILSERAATSVPGYTSLLQQVATFIFKGRKERRNLEEINEAIHLTHQTCKPCEKELARIRNTSTCPTDGASRAVQLQLVALREQTSCLQKRSDKQLHVNSKLKDRMAFVQGKISRDAPVCRSLLQRQQMIADTVSAVWVNIDLERRGTRMLKSASSSLRECIDEWAVVAKLIRDRNALSMQACATSKIGETVNIFAMPTRSGDDGQARYQAIELLRGLLHAHRQVLGLFIRAHELDMLIGDHKSFSGLLLE
eukprot:jgi/Ulvmu1/605/UM001_0613.1